MQNENDRSPCPEDCRCGYCADKATFSWCGGAPDPRPLPPLDYAPRPRPRKSGRPTQQIVNDIMLLLIEIESTED